MAELKIAALLNMLYDFDSIRKTLRALNAQTDRQYIEVIIVTTKSSVDEIDEALLQDFGAFQIIALDHIESGAHGWAIAITKAVAPIIVLCEDHSFPAPNWAATLIDAHKGDYFAVAPAIENGNPDTLVSWANFTLTFLEWFAPDQSRLIDFAPGHNTSYKRELLLQQYGDDLPKWFGSERVLHYDFQTKGYTIFLDARTSTAHVNISIFGSYLRHSYYGARIFGSSRAQHWTVAQKALYTLGAPLVPIVRFIRILRILNTREKRHKAHLFPASPIVALGLYCHALGEVVGYWAGVGNANDHHLPFELRRRDFVLPQERSRLLS